MATLIDVDHIDWSEVPDGTIASGRNLGLNSSNKLVKASVSGGSGGGISFDGSTANGILTYKDSDEATVESNITFDGNTLTVSGNVSNNYVAIIDNDQSSAGHGLKVTSDGSSTGTYLLELESGSSSLLRVRADGSVGIGATTMGQKLTVEGDIGVASDIVHKGDSDTKIAFTTDDISIQAGGVEFIKITENDSQDVLTINDSGADIDFIVESPNESKALYLHSGNEVFHINHGESNFQTKIHNTNDLALTVNSTGVVLNDDGHASNDFRVESDNNDHMLFVDSGNDKIGINDNSPISELSVAGKISITSESSTPSAPADGHGWLYTKSDGKIYWQSSDVSETDLTASGGGSSASNKVYIETFEQLKTQGSGVSISNYTSNIENELLTIGGYGFNQIKDYIMTSADGSTWTAWDNTSTSDLGQHYFRNQVTGDSGYSSGAYGDDGYFQSKVISTAHIVPISGTITKIWLKGQQLDGKELRMRAWLSTSGISNSANGSSAMEVGATGSHIVFTELNDGESSPTFWNGYWL